MTPTRAAALWLTGLCVCLTFAHAARLEGDALALLLSAAGALWCLSRGLNTVFQCPHSAAT